MKLKLSVEHLAKTGEGVARHDGRAIFVEGALPGEVVIASVEEVDRALIGTLHEVVTASPARRAAPCPHAARCGGCDWQHVDEAVQRAQKEQIVVSALEHIGRLSTGAYELLPTVASPRPWAYRRRAELHPTSGRLGFNARHSHQRVPIDQCPALEAPLEGLPGQLSDALGAAALKDVEGVSLLAVAGKVALSIELKGASKPKLVERVEQLLRAQLVNGVVLTPKSGAPVVFGEPELVDEKGVRYRPDAFSQANADVNAVLVGQAIEALQLSSSHCVLELCSGNGNFTRELARRSREVLAVESSAVSVSLASKAEKPSHVRVVQGDAARVVKGLIAEKRRFDRLLVDPPRAGLPSIASWAKALEVERLVYVACDPGALARDAASLAQHGYQPLTLQLFDLFPQTRHVEAVMSFGRANARSG